MNFIKNLALVGLGIIIGVEFEKFCVCVIAREANVTEDEEAIEIMNTFVEQGNKIYDFCNKSEN